MFIDITKNFSQIKHLEVIYENKNHGEFDRKIICIDK